MSCVEFSDQPHLMILNHITALISLLPDQKILFTVNPLISSCKSTDGPPTLDTLRNFPVTNERIDIAVEIGTDYDKFGTLLLEDKKGNIVDSIAKSKHYVPVDITVEILKHWLQGKGRKPVAWQTLVKCLRDTDLNALADNMESLLSEQKDSNKNPSEEL